MDARAGGLAIGLAGRISKRKRNSADRQPAQCLQSLSLSRWVGRYHAGVIGQVGSCQGRLASWAGLLLQGILLFLVPVAMSAQFDLKSLQWTKRVVVVFASDSASPELLEQRRILDSASCGIRERDIAIILAVKGEPLSVDGRSVSGDQADGLRERFQVDSDQFRALLIGKDGGVKLSSGKPVAAAELFARIDSMPMRRSEMRRRTADPCSKP